MSGDHTGLVGNRDQRGVERVVTLDAVHNFRDLGGYASSDGRVTRWRTLFRADGLHRLTPGDVERLRPLGLQTVIDLRTRGEIDTSGRFPLEAHPVTYHHLPLLDVLWSEADRPVLDDAVEFLREAYHEMLAAAADRFATAFALLARPGALPAVFHCSAGKDRTGLLAALLLAGLGVGVGEIAEDYGLTATAIERMLACAATTSTAESWKTVPAVYLAAPPRAMEHVLDDLIARHGSVEAYLGAIGVSPDDLARLRDAVLMS